MKNVMSFFAICAVSILFTASAAIPEHRVTNLPGLTDASKLLPQYSGYLDLNSSVGCRVLQTRHIHYWFVLAEQDPANAPVVLWLNGGPGASSVWGALAENGPYHTSDFSLEQNTSATPAIFYNEYGYQKVANVLYIEAPAGVGYSYCDGDKGPVRSCPTWNDTATAQDNRAFIELFFNVYYPEFLANEFFVTGESYAGVYIPMLVDEISKHAPSINLKGVMAGNGCMGSESEFGCCGKNADRVYVDYIHAHGLISNRNHQSLVSQCSETLESSEWPAPTTNPVCKQLIEEFTKESGGYNVYSIYDTCFLKNDNRRRRLDNTAQWSIDDHSVRLFSKLVARKHMPWLSSAPKHPGNAGTGAYPCGSETAMHVWLNRPEVRSALHVRQIKWADHDGWAQYVITEKDVTSLYEEYSRKYRTQIYFGDLDSGVPYTCGEAWTSSFGWDVVEDWRPWTTDGSTLMGGYSTTYQASAYKNFTFITFRGSGHMVPQFKPAAALLVLDHFLKNIPLPRFNGSALEPPH